MAIINDYTITKGIRVGSKVAERAYSGSNIVFDTPRIAYLGDCDEINEVLKSVFPISGSTAQKHLVFINKRESSWVQEAIVPTVNNSRPIGVFFNPNTSMYYIAPVEIGTEIIKYEFPWSCHYMFAQTGLSSIDFGHEGLCDTSKVEQMSFMFYANPELQTVNLRNIDTSSVMLMDDMFEDCVKLTTIVGLTELNVSSVIDFSYFLANTAISGVLDFSSYVTIQVKYFTGMFMNCKELLGLVLNTDFRFNNCIATDYMFYGCINIISIDTTLIGTFNIKHIDYMYYNCHKYNGTVYLRSTVVETYESCFEGCATVPPSQVKVNYNRSNTIIDDIIATKSSNSNVIKGNRVTG